MRTTPRRTTRLARLTATGALVAGLTVLAAPAHAATDPAPTPTGGPTVTVDGATTTITVDTARLEQACSRVPDAVDRLDALVARIQAGADSPGSVAWLHAQAEAARADGRDAAARRMDGRADLRAGRVTTLRSAADRLRTLDESVCAALDAS